MELSYRTVIRWLHELNFYPHVPRRWPERQKRKERQELLEQPQLLAHDLQVELWVGNECGAECDLRSGSKTFRICSFPN
jgi:hypothetical protein